MKKLLLILLPLFLINGCSDPLPIPEKQESFTQKWKSIKSEYKNATTSLKRGQWEQKGVDLLKGNKSKISEWYGTIINVNSNNYLFGKKY